MHKTQVFVAGEGDHYRTRLTHSLEVAQIGRSLARRLGLDEDLTEVLALAHDLGHTPFGHAGEDALDACMAPFGGFDHNAQTLRIVTHLEQRYAGFDGLNLTVATLDGLIKHNGPVARPDGSMLSLPYGMATLIGALGVDPARFACAEAQIASLSDDIAYNNHDIDDGLRAGLFDIDQLLGLPLVGAVLRQIDTMYPGLERKRLIHESVRRLTTLMIDDLFAETSRRIAEHHPESPDDVAALGAPLAAFSDAMRDHHTELRVFLRDNMYRHPRVEAMMGEAVPVVTALFALFVEQPACLPADIARLCEAPKTASTARVVADFIAGMTDRFARHEYRRLFGGPANGGTLER